MPQSFAPGFAVSTATADMANTALSQPSVVANTPTGSALSDIPSATASPASVAAPGGTLTREDIINRVNQLPKISALTALLIKKDVC